MIIGIILYAVMALFLAWAIMAGLRAWQRPRYTMEEFWAASERIFVAVAALTWVVEGTELALPDGFVLPQWASAKGALNGKPLRRECRAMLRDILANTSVIMDQAERCCGGLPADDPTALKCMRAINGGGWALLVCVRWTELLLALPPALGVRSTLQAGQKYALLWLALVQVVRELHPELYDVGEELAV